MKGAYEINTAQPTKPRSQVKAAPISLSRSSRARRTGHMDYLSERMKAGLLVVLAEGSVTHEGRLWRGSSGKTVARETIEALFDRYMIVVATEIRPKRKHVASLTEIGRLVAERLQIAEAETAASLRRRDISEAAQRLIVAMIDDFEDSPNVYPPEQESVL